VRAGAAVCTTRGATTVETLLDVTGGADCEGDVSVGVGGDADVTGGVEWVGCDLTTAWGAGSGPGPLDGELGGAFCGDGSAL